MKMIVAVDEEFGIGKNNKIPWHSKEDMQFFKQATTGHIIVMGRKTFESLPKKPLPNRLNIVLSSSVDPRHAKALFHALERNQREGVVFFHSLVDLIKEIKASDLSEEILIIGGASLYEQSLPYVQGIYLTQVLGKFDCDRKFEKNWLLGFEQESIRDLSLTAKVSYWKRQP